MEIREESKTSISFGFSMANKFLIKTIFLFFVAFAMFFISGGKNISAQPFSGSGTVSVSATVPELITVTPSGGGSTSGSIALPNTAVGFSGYAYPSATVTLLKNGEVVAKVNANSDGSFSITLEEGYNSNVLYSLFAEDLDGNRSLLVNYPLVVKTGYFTQLSGIRFAPTIVTDKSEVRLGDYLSVNGYALPERELEVKIQGVESKIFTLYSSINGTYKIVIPMASLQRGEYSIYVNYKNDSRVSKFIKFTLGGANIFYTDTSSDIPGDCNADKIINLVDFSILAFWYGKNNPPTCVDTNKDGEINLTDFSILAFYWTG